MSIRSVSRLDFVWPTLDPFLFCVHHSDIYPPGGSDMRVPAQLLRGRNMGNDFELKDGFRMYHGEEVPGFPQHPHRGFETITITVKGFVDHSDSLGATARFGEGDVQWVTAGSGIAHSEMFPLLKENQTNECEFFQIWLNLPKSKKMSPGHFSMLWSESIPVVFAENTAIRVIAGKFADVVAPSPPPSSWASEPNSDVSILTINMDKNAAFSIPKSEANRNLYLFGGEITINGKSYSGEVGLTLDAGEVRVESAAGAKLLYLQARPINEPVVKYGPFVMNTQNEIRDAYADYSKTHFGGWPWSSSGPVHPRAKGRFALRLKNNVGVEELPPAKKLENKSRQDQTSKDL